jgi:hypothetical protein
VMLKKESSRKISNTITRLMERAKKKNGVHEEKIAGGPR